MKRFLKANPRKLSSKMKVNKTYIFTIKNFHFRISNFHRILINFDENIRKNCTILFQI